MMGPELESLLALRDELLPGDQLELDEMVSNETPLLEIAEFISLALTYKQTKKYKYSEAQKADLEYMEYYEDLSPKDKKWIKQFYHEMYCNGVYSVPKDKRILNEARLIAESNRKHYMRKVDMLDLALSTTHSSIDDINTTKGNILKDWQSVHKYQGYPEAVRKIHEEGVDEYNAGLNISEILIRFHIKINELETLERSQKKSDRDKTRIDKRKKNETK